MSKTVFITGAQHGLGKVIAEEFDQAGHSLILHSHHFDFEADKAGHYCFATDLSSGPGIKRIKENLQKKKVDIFINNAAIYQGGSLDEISDCELQKIIAVNLTAPILLIKELWPIPLIININSLAGKTGSRGESVYSASKHGLRGLLSSLQFEATENNCRIIDLYIGAMKTKMMKHREDFENLIDPKEVAQVILQLIKNYKTMRITEMIINRQLYQSNQEI